MNKPDVSCVMLLISLSLSPDPLSVFPTLIQLSELPVDDVWLNIGLQLGLDHEELTAIEKKSQNSQECKTAMFLAVRMKFPEFRFETLSKALLKGVLLVLNKSSVYMYICMRYDVVVDYLCVYLRL